MMRVVVCLVCLWLGAATFGAPAPQHGQPAPQNADSDLWLTVRFDPLSDVKASAPDAEISALVTTGVKFRQQVSVQTGSFGISGFVSVLPEGNYLLFTEVTSGPSPSYPEWTDRLIRIGLNQPRVIRIDTNNAHCQYTVTLSRAPHQVDHKVKGFPLDTLPFSVPYVPPARQPHSPEPVTPQH
jgi:hypothetical protein